MSHELEEIRGKVAMAYYGTVPWHSLGTKLDKPATAEEALKAASLDWKVQLAPLFVPFQPKANEESGPLLQVKTNNAVVRPLDNSILGVVGTSYRPVQNKDAFDFFDSVVGAGKAIYHTAGSIFGGKRVWILAQLPGDMVVGEKDIIERYILFANSHDGTMAVRMFYTPVRVVCFNTMTFALNRGEGQGISLRHVGNVKSKIKVAQEALGLGVKYYDELKVISDDMLKKQLDEGMVNDFIKDVFASDDEGTVKNEVMNELMLISKGATGTTIPGQEGTLWHWLNVVTEYVDHLQPKTGGNEAEKRDSRFDSILFGTGKVKKQRAFEAAMGMMI
jgi:phage/plasmid-like protein (TIGR03299 family)